jgi:hypothetical protein
VTVNPEGFLDDHKSGGMFSFGTRDVGVEVVPILGFELYVFSHARSDF